MPGRVGTAALSGQQARAFRIDAGVHCTLSPKTQSEASETPYERSARPSVAALRPRSRQTQ